jgi:hypothetical protein
MPSTPHALRDHAMVAMLIGCGLRRAELLALTLESIQQREEHWVIADLVGKGGHVRTVPIPGWVKAAVDAWTDAVNITHGPAFRAINKAGRVWGDGMSPKVLWEVVRAAAGRAGIDRLRTARSPAHLCAALPLGWRRTGSDPIPPWARLDPDDGALPWMQAATTMRGQRPSGNRAGRCLSCESRGGRENVRPWRLLVRNPTAGERVVHLRDPRAEERDSCHDPSMT